MGGRPVNIVEGVAYGLPVTESDFGEPMTPTDGPGEPVIIVDDGGIPVKFINDDMSDYTAGITPAMAMLTAYSRTLTDEVAAYEATYTGASHKTMFDQYGLLTFGPNNLLTYSSTFENAAWVKATNVNVTDNAVTGPSGLTNGASVEWTSASTNTGLYTVTTAPASGSQVIRAVWVRADVASGTVALVDPATTVGTSTVNITTDWQLLELKEVRAGTGAGVWIRKTASSPNTIYIAEATLSSVTHETTQRTCDKVVTTSAAYYGPRFVYAPETLEASTTSITIGSGSSYTFTTAAAHSFAEGDVVQATDNADPDNWIRGYVTATTSTTVTLASYTFPGTAYSRPVLTNGSGTISDWSVIRSDGYLAEPAATNLLTRSNDFSFSSPWSTDPTGQTSTANEVGPDGVANSAWTLSDVDTGLRGRIATITVANDGTTYTVSCHFKKTTSAAAFPGFGLVLSGGTIVYGQITVNTDDGTLNDRTSFGPSSSTIYDEGDYWRVSATRANNSSGNTTLSIVIYPAVNTDGSGTWSGTTTGSSVVYGVQTEIGSVATSYIPTAASSVARSADVDSLSTATWWNGSGTFFQRAKTPAVGALSILKLDDGTANEVIDLYTNGTDPVLQITDGGSTQLAPLDLGTVTADTFHDYAIRIATNNVNGALDGTAVTADTTATLPTVTALSMGEHGGVAHLLYFTSEEIDSVLETGSGG